MSISVEEHLTDIIRYFSRTTNSPAEVTKEAVDSWGEERILDGLMYTTVAHKKNDFWRLLKKTGWITNTPDHLLKFEQFGIPLKEFPPRMRADAEAVLKWKQAPFAPNRPKKGKIRAVTAIGLRLTISQLAGFVLNVCGASPETLKDLFQKHFIEGFVEYAINERHVKGRTIQLAIARLAAVVKYHPGYSDRDWAWLKPLIDSIPLEDESEIKKRKAAIQLGVYSTEGDHQAKGGSPDHWPEDLNVREWPEFTPGIAANTSAFRAAYGVDQWKHYRATA